VQAHWGIPDPAAAAESDWGTAFQTAYDTLSRKAVALLDLPLETLSASDLKSALNRIAHV